MDFEIPEGVKSCFTIVLAIIVAVVLIVVLSNFAPTSAGAKAAVENQGFTNVTVSDPLVLEARFYCAEDDYFYFNAHGTNSLGKEVDVYVCAGFLKGYTIRSH